MAEDTDQDKTEDATSHKLRKAREKGQVAKGMDLGFLAALCGLTGYAWARGDMLRATIAANSARALITAPQLGDGTGALAKVIWTMARAVVEPVALLAGTVWLIVAIFDVVQTGAVFAPSRIKPDFSRLNPVSGLKRLFTVRTLIEAGKSLLKMALYGAASWMVIRNALSAKLTGLTDGRSLADAMVRVSFQLLLCCALVALLIAAVDQLLSRRQFATLMRMSRREVRRELRDHEGEPRIKQRRKQIHREFVQAAKSLTGVRSADFVVVNPIHYAIGLQYSPSRMAAPRVVARGRGAIAGLLKDIAFRARIPIIPDPALARSLYRKQQLDSEVTEDFYVEIARIYRENHITPKDA